ncbi:MAG: cytochrome b/b6 domain-containing protein [Rhodospirillales bacterium]|nr:cytochrome b/b6 domain-containing protein [Rhodospirillales bacterium]
MSKELLDEAPSIKVWDMPTRAFHWSVLTLAVLAWITSEAEGALFWTHLAAGYGVMGLIVFRLVWGVIGTRHARFHQFVRPWRVVRTHIQELRSFSPAPFLGHTPPGGWMIIALLAVMSLIVVTGLFSGDDGDAGPLAYLVSPWLADALGEVHEAGNGLLWTLVVVHVGGVLAVSFLTKDNLIRAMWTGRKNNPERFPDPEQNTGQAADIPPAGWLRTAIAVLVAAGSVAALLWMAGP